MFRGENQSLHPSFFGDAHNLVRIKVSGIEKRRVLIAVSPLFVGESVDGEMYEPIELQLVPSEVACAEGVGP